MPLARTLERFSMKDLAGKTAFVTGAASGIGLGIATALAQAGVKVDPTPMNRSRASKSFGEEDYGKAEA
jgi:NAD(P)-dependent dehydrogenase (short-subunit alcohol dehydrogenase family)